MITHRTVRISDTVSLKSLYVPGSFARITKVELLTSPLGTPFTRETVLPVGTKPWRDAIHHFAPKA